MLLKNKVAMITGGAQGIGRGIAHRFAEEGAKVVVGDLDADKGTAVADELKADGLEALFCHMDVTNLESIEDCLKVCLLAYDRIDILVNNAGINLGGSVVELAPTVWEKVLAVNLTGSFLCSQVFCRQMIAQGEGGAVIFISSQAGKRGEPNAAAYVASKFGVLGLMESLAVEVAGHGIRANAICPGNVDTPMIYQLFESEARTRGITPDQAKQFYLDLNPLKRLATPAEIANVCVFLASSLSSYVIGESINVDAGELSG
jgi:NAD(P)-dependent dehydrogenase (short-subunit alcohol dehydrogenase family)